MREEYSSGVGYKSEPYEVGVEGDVVIDLSQSSMYFITLS